MHSAVMRSTLKGRPAFGSHLRRLRNRRKLSQVKLGALVDWDKAKISRIENGEAAPLLQDFDRLAKALDVGVGQLLRTWAKAARRRTLEKTA